MIPIDEQIKYLCIDYEDEFGLRSLFPSQFLLIIHGRVGTSFSNVVVSVTVVVVVLVCYRLLLLLFLL